MNNFLISVIIPVFNRPKLLKRAIESIPKREDIEIIVINDGSTDNTAKDIIETDNLKIITFKENQGRSIARNAGINIAKGQYLLMLDSDDYIITNNFSKIISYLDGTDLVYYDLIDNNNVLLHLDEKSKKVLVGTTKFMRKNFVGLTRYPMKVEFGEDLILMEKLKRKNPTEVFTNIPIIHYNQPRKNEDDYN